MAAAAASVLESASLQSAPLDLPPLSDILYPDFFAPVPVPTEPGSPPPAPAFVVDSIAKADWAVRRILDAQARIDSRADLASELHARVDAWLTKANAPDNDSIVYISSLLRPFAEAEIAKQHRSRSLFLPSGTAQLRKLPDRLSIDDAEAAISFCETQHPSVVIVKKDISRAELKRIIFSDGDAIPGVTAELGSTELYIKPNA
jgi:hypothetical protein